MDLGLEGRRALVTAASAGLGRGAAAALAAEGAQVAICSRDAGRIQAAAEEIGHGTIGLVGDVGSPAGATDVAERAREALGGIDVLVANTGGPPSGTFASTPLPSYDEAVDLLLTPVVALCQATVPAMQAAGWGRVVAITSVAVRQPIGNLILSNTVRTGLTGFLKTLALEVAADGVTVSSVQPGLHATDRLVQLHGGDLAEATATVPAAAIGDPADLGAVVAFLCSEQARYVTGVALPVDGGLHRGLQ